MTSKHIQRRPFVILVLSTLIVLMVGALTLALQMQQRQGTRADSGSVVGQPSLPAANVDAVFARVGSPMVGTGKVVEQAARQANIDDAFALAVWWVETNDGAAGVGRADRNPGSVRGSVGYPAAYDGYTIYPSYSVAITDWFNVLKSRYINRGLTSVYAICYPYVGTSSASLWAGKVLTLMQRYRGEAPPPTPTPTATPIPTPTRAPLHMENNEPRRDMAMPEVRADQRSRQAVDQQGQTHVSTLTAAQPLLIGLGALLAVILALLAIKMTGRGTPVEMKPVETKRHDPITPPPLFVNEFSPIIERETTALLVEDWIAELSLSETSEEPMVAEDDRVAVGAVPRAKHAEKGLRRRRMVPLAKEGKTEQIAVVERIPERQGQERETGALLYRPGGIGLRGREPEAVGASSGGLLSRYGNKKQE